MLLVYLADKLEALVAVVVIPVPVPGGKLPAVFSVARIVGLAWVPIHVIDWGEVSPLELGV